MKPNIKNANQIYSVVLTLIFTLPDRQLRLALYFCVIQTITAIDFSIASAIASSISPSDGENINGKEHLNLKKRNWAFCCN